MMHWRILLTVILIPGLLLAGCGSDNKTAQDSIRYSLSSQKGKDQMPTQSPMLNEILASAKGIAPGKYNDVIYIVSKYIPIGTSKEQTKIILERMNQEYDEVEDIIYAGYVGNNLPMVPNPRIFIELKFNHSGYLEFITARYSYAQ